MDVEPEWQTRHPIRALARDGKSLVLAELQDLKRRHMDDYKKIMRVLRMAGETVRVQNENCVKQSGSYREIHEIRGGQARLFFFYTPDTEQIVVCANLYWKAKPSKAEQDAAFSRCERFRAEYLRQSKPN